MKEDKYRAYWPRSLTYIITQRDHVAQNQNQKEWTSLEN